MPLGSPTVGEAYIRIIADTSRLHDDVRDALIREAPTMERMGEKSTQHFEDGVRKEMKKNRGLGPEVIEQLNKDMGRISARGHILGDDFSKNVIRSVQQNFKDAKIDDRWVRRLGENLDKELREAVIRGTVSMQQMGKEGRKLAGDLQGVLLRAEQKTDKEMDRTSSSVSNLGRKMEDLEKKVRRTRLGRIFGEGSRNDFLNIIGKVIGKMAQFGALLGIRTVRHISNFSTALRKAEGVGGKLRVVFGAVEGAAGLLAKGLFGLIGGLAVLNFTAGPVVALLADLAGGVTALAGALTFGLIGALGAATPLLVGAGIAMGVFALGLKHAKDVAPQAVKELKQFGKEAGKIAAQHMFKDLGEDVKTARPALAGLLRFVGLVGDALSNVMGHFAKTLASPAFAKFQKSMSDTMPGIIRRLGNAAVNVFSGFTGVLRQLLPYGQKLADNLLDMTNHFAKWANSAKGQNAISDFMFKAWQSALKLWDLLKNLYNVLKDVLSAAQPTGNTFLDSMNSALERLDEFLTSNRGQRAMESWMNQTKTFMKHLGGALGGIGQLFSALNNSGSQGALNGLLDIVGGFARVLARMLPDVLDLIDAISPVFAAAIGTVAAALKPLVSFLASHETVAKTLAAGFLALYAAFKIMKTVQFASGLITSLQTFYGNLATQIRLGNAKVKLAAGGLIGAVAILGGFATGQAAGQAGSALGAAGSALGSAAAGAIGGGMIAGAPGAVIGGIAGAVSSLIGTLKGLHDQSSGAVEDSAAYQAAMQKNAEHVAEWEANVSSLTQSLLASKGAVDENIVASIRQQLSDTDVLRTSKQLGLNLQDVMKGALGGDEAAAVLTALSKANGDVARSYSDIITAGGKAAENVALQREAAGKSVIANNKLGTSLKDLKGALNLSTKFLQFNGLAGAHNKAVVEANVEAINQNVKANLRNGQSVQEAASKYKSQIGTLEANLRQLGYNRQEIMDVVAAYGKIPPKVATALLKSGVLPEDIQKIVDKYLQIPPSRKTDVTADVHGQDDLDRMHNSINSLNDKTVRITTENIINTTITRGGPSGRATGLMAGAIVNGPMRPLVGEAGPEAIVPLGRSLSRVNPTVRALSAFAQGQSKIDNSPRVKQDITLNVYPASADPSAVAQNVLNRAVALTRI